MKLKVQLRNNKKAFSLALLLAGSLQMCNSSYASALAEIQTVFPDASVNAIQLIATLPNYVVIPTALILTLIIPKVCIEKLLIVGTGCFVAAFQAAFFHSHLWQIYLSAVLMGIAIATALSCCATLVFTHYTGDDQIKFSGMLVSAGSIGGIISNVVSGLLASTAWYNVFFINLVFIPVFLVNLIVMPKNVLPQKIQLSEEQKQASAKSGKKVRPYYYALFFITFTYLGVGSAFHTNNSMLLADKALGNSMTAGFAGGVYMFFSMLLGSFFKRIYDKVSDYCVLIGFGLQICSMVCFIAANNMVVYIIGAVLAGSGVGVALPYCISNVPNYCSESAVSFAATCVNAVASNISALFPLVFTSLSAIVFSGSVPGRMILALIVDVICLVVFSVVIIRHRKAGKV